MNEIISRCGYCGDVIDFCQGHGEDERKAFGFEPDSDSTRNVGRSLRLKAYRPT